MILKDFQSTAVDQLSNTFLELWKTGKYRIPLVFKAPTGAGKTIMMAEFLRCLDDNYQFHEDKAYIWVSFGGDESYRQSKNKFYHYFNEGTDMHLKDVGNLSEGKLYKNNIFFINWSKIKGTDKESKKLRKSGGIGYGGEAVFDEFIQKTRKERDIVLIIDEAHTETETNLASEVVDLINPRIIIKVTATPKEVPSNDDVEDKKAGYVRVKEEDVIKSGLIKEKIIIQTEEDIKKLAKKEFSEDEMMLDLAFNKRLELKRMYEEAGLSVNPLVLIQLPSDYKEKEEVQKNLRALVLAYLKQKRVSEDEIAFWFSGNDKKNLSRIEENDNKVNFMIFKVAPATGWDCPRADILVMFREIKSPSFHTQIIGRIKRMPEGEHYEKRELNHAYIFTNYSKGHIRDMKEAENKNKYDIYHPKLKKGIEKIVLETTYHKRTDFNTLTPPEEWQPFFLQTLDKEFGVKKEAFSENLKIAKPYFDFSAVQVNNRIVVNAEIESFDHFAEEIKEKGKNFDHHFSQLDVERLYNLLCFEELKKQGDEDAQYNPSRSWSQLKQAINVWFNTRFGLERKAYYPVVVNELLKETSDLKMVISKALKGFRVQYEIKISGKEGKEIFDVELPETEAHFTEDFEKMDGVKKNAYEEFYIRKSYLGKENELKFIAFLESQKSVLWWHKQDDSGKKVFSIEYFDAQEKKNRLFYPDFIVRTKNKVYLFDPKNEITAKSTETRDKSDALQKWLKKNRKKYDFEIDGGIVIEKYPHWKVNKKEKYVYENEKDWENLEMK